MKDIHWKKAWDWVIHTRLYVEAMVKWLVLAGVTGVICGVIGSAFHIGVEEATGLRELHPWLLWLLPAAGLAIAGIYRLLGTEGQGTNDIIDAVHLGRELSISLLPAIFIGTILTHLCGGSAGREGAALQMGGTIGYHTGWMLGLDDRDMRTATLTGMAAFFAALFGTPLAAAVFAMMVVSIGVVYDAAFIPCLTAALTAYGVSRMMGVEPTRFTVEAPGVLDLWLLVRVAVLAALCALVSVLFCTVIHVVEHQMHRRLPNVWLRAAVGGVVVVGLTHLCGGSAGREGAALQMGGTIGHHVGALFRLDDRDMRTATMAGMAAFFAALFGTPLTATVFAMVVISIGVMYHAAFIPCLTASLVAYGVSLLMGVEPTHFTVDMPALETVMLLRVAVLGALCALVSILFCNTVHFAEHQMARRIPNAWVRVAAGGVGVIALTYLCGTTDYNGAGMDVITAAVEQGSAHPAAFLLKILFTAVTLSAGFKGGEVVPSFFVGATFGCVAGPLLGIPASFGGALGLVAVFCGAVNCPVASIFLSVELFGDGGLLYFALICGISYMLSGYNGLYSSQTILYSKLKAQYINVHTNAHHAGNPHAEPPVRGSLKE